MRRSLALSLCLVLTAFGHAQQSPHLSKFAEAQVQALRELIRSELDPSTQWIVANRWLEIDPAGGLDFAESLWHKETSRNLAVLMLINAVDRELAGRLVDALPNADHKAKAKALLEDRAKGGSQESVSEPDLVHIYWQLIDSDPYRLSKYIESLGKDADFVRQDLALLFVSKDFPESSRLVHRIVSDSRRANALILVASKLEPERAKECQEFIDEALGLLSKSRLSPIEKFRGFRDGLQLLAQAGNKRVLPFLRMFVQPLFASLDAEKEKVRRSEEDMSYGLFYAGQDASGVAAMISFFDLAEGDALFRQSQEICDTLVEHAICDSYLSESYLDLLRNMLEADPFRTGARLKADFAERDQEGLTYVIPIAATLAEEIAASDRDQCRQFLAGVGVPVLQLELEAYYQLKAGVSAKEVLIQPGLSRDAILCTDLSKWIPELAGELARTDANKALELFNCLHQPQSKVLAMVDFAEQLPEEQDSLRANVLDQARKFALEPNLGDNWNKALARKVLLLRVAGEKSDFFDRKVEVPQRRT